jgi:hypothetical protein
LIKVLLDFNIKKQKNLDLKGTQMKKIMIVALMLLVTTLSLFAEKVVLIQGTYLSTSRIFEDTVGVGYKETDTFNEVGINITSFTGKTLGFYASATFLLPLTWKVTTEQTGYPDTESDGDFNSDNTNLGIDMLLGVGYLLPLGNSFSLLIGAGVHYNGYFIIGDYDTAMSNVLGAGLAANFIINLSEKFNLNISAMGAWDLYEIHYSPERSSLYEQKSGYTLAVSAGLGYSY